MCTSARPCRCLCAFGKGAAEPRAANPLESLCITRLAAATLLPMSSAEFGADWEPGTWSVTLKPEAGEALVYGGATPLIVESRQARATFLSKSGSRVERARGGFPMCELGLVLIGDTS